MGCPIPLLVPKCSNIALNICSDENYNDNRRNTNGGKDNNNNSRGNRFARDVDRRQEADDNSYNNRN